MKRKDVKEIYKLAEEMYYLSCEYCALIENTVLNENNTTIYIDLLMRLYLTAIKLPYVFGQYTSKTINEEIETMKKNLQQNVKIDTEDLYAQIFNPFDPDAGIDEYYISGDLSEIYEDIKEGMILYEKGLKREAVWVWSYGCDIHWGRHLISVLRPLHSLRIFENI